MKSNSKIIEAAKKQALVYKFVVVDSDSKVTMHSGDVNSMDTVEFIACRGHRVIVSRNCYMGAVARSCGEGIGLIRGSGRLIDSLNYGIEKYIDGMGQNTQPYTWSFDECVDDLNSWKVELEAELEKHSDCEVTVKHVSDSLSHIDDIINGYDEPENQQQFFDKINDLWDDYEDRPYDAGQMVSSECVWTLTMLWRVSALMSELEGGSTTTV